jgi:hypothetical protein
MGRINMKIAILGNMNNNGFSFLRYFRDLGFDAHLVLYEDDGKFSHEHFSPEADTWFIDEWSPFITRMAINNSITPMLEFPSSWISCIPSILRRIFYPNQRFSRPVSTAYVKKVFSEYDYLVGSGNLPALCAKAGIRLDIFTPYCAGVEYVGYVGYLDAIRKSNFFVKRLLLNARKRQIDGILNTRFVLNAEVGASEETLKKIGAKSLRLPMPMVYTGEDYSLVRPDEMMCAIRDRIKKSKFSVLHHARVLWVNSNSVSIEDWRMLSKNTNWLVESFAKLVVDRSEVNPLLVMIEYGPDVDHTKKLVGRLGIENCVLWLPKMKRRELMWILSQVTIGCGEFLEARRMIWGGTGWETLASGKPLLQAFNFYEGEFEQLFGYPPPPMLPARNQHEILQKLLFVVDHPLAAEEIGHAAKEWFHRYNGVSLAKKWLDLLAQPLDTEMATRA